MLACLVRWICAAPALTAPLVLFAASTIDTYQFDSAADEARFRTLIDELRCPKCLNTNLAGSDAAIAHDLRREVYLQIQSGAGDDEIKAYLQARYGDFILYNPPFNARTALVWLLPGMLLLIGMLIALRVVLRGREERGELTAEESADLDTLLGEAASRPQSD